VSAMCASHFCAAIMRETNPDLPQRHRGTEKSEGRNQKKAACLCIPGSDF
jgi:hypothetical protein